jgi:hypothetical protein
MPSAVDKDGFGASFGPVAEEYEQRQQQEMQADDDQPPEQPERCCAGDKCTFKDNNPPVPLRNDFVHKCRHTGLKTHAPCGEEVVVEGRPNNREGVDLVVKVESTGATFPISRLAQTGHGDANGAVSGISETCRRCLDTLLKDSSDDSDINNRGRANEEEARGMADEEKARLRALFKVVCPVLPDYLTFLLNERSRFVTVQTGCRL